MFNVVGGLGFIALGIWAFRVAIRGDFSKYRNWGRTEPIPAAQAKVLFIAVGVAMVAAGAYFIWYGVASEL
jgi:hypothetical protein